MEILICTDGSSSSIQSADLLIKIGFPAMTQIVVLGVSDNKIDVGKLNLSMDQLISKLGGISPIVRKVRYGNPSEEILAEAVEFSYNLVVVGGGREQLDLLQPQLGSTTSQLSRKLHTHFLVARNIPDEIRKILVCVGRGILASETMSIGGAWIANTSAQIGLLHVDPRRERKQGSGVKAGGDNHQPSLEDRGEAELVLKRANQQLCEAGVNNEIIPRIRQGLVVDEVLKEISEGEYDLLVIGAHYQPGQDRWQGALFDDITDQLLNRSRCSVLII